ncbi:MAG: FAD-binding protein [Actinobacteria bacterium]|nr:FAD-binding protein [Actinomycetota bacterium]
MDFFRPVSLAEALELKAAHPECTPIAGGTDLMVELNFDKKRPETIIDLTACSELQEWSRDNGTVRVGAGVPYSRIIAELATDLPGLAIASRTVGSPQIRNRGTLGGNLGTASPAGDGIPPLVAVGASVELASTSGTRSMPVTEFITGVKENALRGEELITAINVPGSRGPQQFSKIGTRNAMVIAVATFSVALDLEARSVGTALGSCSPRPLRASDAEAFIADEIDWDGRTPLPESAAARFGELVADAARPIDDVRGTAAYRKHALKIMAKRTLTWTWEEART